VLARSNLSQQQRDTCWFPWLHACFSERQEENEALRRAEQKECDSSSASSMMPEDQWITAARLTFCVVGILSTYLCYGVLQEGVMTQDFDGSAGLFNDSNFIVASSRLVALLLSMLFMLVQHLFFASTKVPHTVPLYMYLFGSFSNNISTQAQYEMLKYLSFPLQVLGKSCKVPPVMFFEFFLNRRVYTFIEYSLGVIIVLGALDFQLFSQYQPEGTSIDTLPDQYKATGLALLVLYIVADAFTSNWQHKLFVDYSVDWIAMSVWSNFYSLILSLAGLVFTSELAEVWQQVSVDKELALAIFLLSLTSAIGNCFIFYTIRHFGPVVFSMIATVRQLLSIIISIDAFDHEINAMQWFGIVMVFSAIFAPLPPKLRRDAAKRSAAIKRANKKLEQAMEEKAAEEREKTRGSSWLACVDCCAPREPPLLPKTADDLTTEDSRSQLMIEQSNNSRDCNCRQVLGMPARSCRDCREVYDGSTQVQISVTIALLSTIHVSKALLTKTIFVQLGLPTFFAWLSALVTILMLSLYMGSFPTLFAFPTVRRDVYILAACAVFVALDVVGSYRAMDLLPLHVYQSIRNFDIIVVGIAESLYLRALPSWVTIVFVFLLAASSLLTDYSHDDAPKQETYRDYEARAETEYSPEYTYKVEPLGVCLAVACVFVSAMKQVMLRVAMRHMYFRLTGVAFTYWVELMTCSILMIWAIANGDFYTFGQQLSVLTPEQSLAICIASLMGGLRLIFQVALLRQASAITSAVADILASALITVFTFCIWGTDDAYTTVVTSGEIRIEHSSGVYGVNIAGLSLTCLILALYVYYHVTHPLASPQYPPLEGEEPPALTQPAKAIGAKPPPKGKPPAKANDPTEIVVTEEPRTTKAA